MSRTLLAIDAGTTGVTTILFDEQLETLARSSREFEQLFPEPGQVEHSAEAILEALDATLTEVLAGVQVAPAAVGIANQRETVFALDLESGRALGTGIVWQDRRTAALCSELKRLNHEALVSEKTGLLLDPYFSATKIAWILDNIPNARQRAERGELAFGTVDTWLLWNLTDGQSHAT